MLFDIVVTRCVSLSFVFFYDDFQATGWVKKEAELEQKKRLIAPSSVSASTNTTSACTTCTKQCTPSGNCPARSEKDNEKDIGQEKKAPNGGFKLSSWFKNVKGGNCARIQHRGWVQRVPRGCSKST